MKREPSFVRFVSLAVVAVLFAAACTPQAQPSPTTKPGGPPTAPPIPTASASPPPPKTAASPAAKAASPSPAAKPAGSPVASPAASPMASPAASPAARPAASPSPAVKPAASPAAMASPPPAATGPVPTEPLRIGAVLSFTGDLSTFGQGMFNGAQLAVDEINAAGGVHGQPVQLIQGDSGTNPQQGQQEARRLIQVERVSAIVGAAASGVSLPIAEAVTGPARVVQISPASTSPALTRANDNDFLFRTVISDAAQGIVLADLARERGINSVCTMYVNNAYGQGLSEQFVQRFQQIGGQVTAQVPHEQEQASYVSELQRCTQGNPQALVAISYPESAGVYLREAVERDLVETFLFVDGTQSQPMFERLGAENFEGMFGTAPGALDTDTGREFDQRYEAEFGQVPPHPFLRESYDAVFAIALAAERARSNDGAAIRDHLRAVSNPPGQRIEPGSDGWRAALQALGNSQDVDYDGTASSVDLDQNGDVLRGAINIWSIQNGQITVEESRTIDLTQR